LPDSMLRIVATGEREDLLPLLRLRLLPRKLSGTLSAA
jgi:hypothetical protein